MTESEPKIAALHSRYRASLVRKRADIEQAWCAVNADPADPASRQVLLGLVHRLAGSAESYGFIAIGQRAAQADMLLGQVRDSAESAGPAAATTARLETLAGEIAELLVELQRGIESGADRNRASG